MPIFSVGHSSRSFQEFSELMRRHGIVQLVDVRSFPTSRKFPHFSQDNLMAALQEINIGYEHLKALGGFRKSELNPSPNAGWESPGFRSYADYMLTDAFEQALGVLLKITSERQTTIMCAEAAPQRCHRQLISDFLLGLRKTPVFHITPLGLKEHRLTSFARIEGGRLVYPRLQRSLIG